MFDTICKFLAENFSIDFANWLLGESVELTDLSPSELSLEPIRADALILRQSDHVVLHIEFQTTPKSEIPFRMADYRLRVHRRFPNKQMHQVVIYLKQTRSEQVHQTVFTLERTHHEFDVIRLWEQPTEAFLQAPGLLPFAVLSQTNDQTQVLRQVAQMIDQLPNPRVKSNVSASTAILAGLVLEKAVIQSLLRSNIMHESSFVRGLQEESREEKAQEIAVNLLREEVALDTIARATGLSIEQIQQLQAAQVQTPAES